MHLNLLLIFLVVCAKIKCTKVLSESQKFAIKVASVQESDLLDENDFSSFETLFGMKAIGIAFTGFAFSPPSLGTIWREVFCLCSKIEKAISLPQVLLWITDLGVKEDFMTREEFLSLYNLYSFLKGDYTVITTLLNMKKILQTFPASALIRNSELHALAKAFKFEADSIEMSFAECFSLFDSEEMQKTLNSIFQFYSRPYFSFNSLWRLLTLDGSCLKKVHISNLKPNPKYDSQLVEMIETNAKTIQSLHLNNCNISIARSGTIQQFESIREIHLSSLTSPFPRTWFFVLHHSIKRFHLNAQFDFFGHWVVCRVLDYNNFGVNLEGLISFVSENPNLEHFAVHHSRLDLFKSAQFKQATKALKYLQHFECSTENNIEEYIGSSKLKSLILHSVDLEVMVFNWIFVKTLTQLKHLEIHADFTIDQSFFNLLLADRLVTLSIQCKEFTPQESTRFFGIISHLRNLNTLSLTFRLNDPIQYLKRNNSLHTLHLKLDSQFNDYCLGHCLDLIFQRLPQSIRAVNIQRVAWTSLNFDPNQLITLKQRFPHLQKLKLLIDRNLIQEALDYKLIADPNEPI